MIIVCVFVYVCSICGGVFGFEVRYKMRNAITDAALLGLLD